MTKRMCTVEGCERPHDARGLCGLHYMRWKQHGDPQFPIIAKSPLERLMAHVDIMPGPMTTDCWVTTYCLNPTTGYGEFKVGGRSRSTHRMVYELLVKPIPKGLVIDHLCRVRACCNPGHLELVTVRENTMRGTSPPANACRTGLCGKGHPLDDAYVTRRGGRACHVCMAAYQRAYRSRRAAAA